MTHVVKQLVSTQMNSNKMIPRVWRKDKPARLHSNVRTNCSGLFHFEAISSAMLDLDRGVCLPFPPLHACSGVQQKAIHWILAKKTCEERGVSH